MRVMGKMIPRYDPTYHYSDLWGALQDCLSEKNDDVLHEQLRDMYNVKHVFTFESARVALFTLLKAFDHPGGVLMPAYNCIVVPEAVTFAGYQPEFADIDLQFLNMTAKTIEAALSPNTTVILATHLFGIPCDVDEVLSIGRRKGLLVVEDAAPAIGSRFKDQLIGTFGDATIISFQAVKVISAENGGALLTNSDELANKVENLLSQMKPVKKHWVLFAKSVSRKLSFHRWIYPIIKEGYKILYPEEMFEIVKPLTEVPEEFFSACPCFSSLLISRQFTRLSWNVEKRVKLAQIYMKELSGHPNITLPVIHNCSPAWIQFPIIVKDKAGFYNYMQHNGVDLSWTYRYSCAESYGFAAQCPNTQIAAKTVLGLPTYPSLSESAAQYIASVAKRYLQR
jgi:perosamine synthetase